MKTAHLLLAFLPLALASLGACGGDDSDAGTTSAGGSSSTGGTSGAAGTGGGVSGGAAGTSGTGGSGGASGTGGAGVAVSTDPLSPTPIAVGESVTATLAMDAENFLQFTPTTAGNHTLNFMAPVGKVYASFAMVKEAHSCGLPACVQGTGTAPLPGLVAGTTYYLNVFNGAPGALAYTISVTSP